MADCRDGKVRIARQEIGDDVGGTREPLCVEAGLEVDDDGCKFAGNN